MGEGVPDSTAPVLIVKPSEWAKRDIATQAIMRCVFGTNTSGETKGGTDGTGSVIYSSFEDFPIVKDGARTLRMLRIEHEDGGFCYLEAGLSLSISLFVNRKLREVLRYSSLRSQIPDLDSVIRFDLMWQRCSSGRTLTLRQLSRTTVDSG